MIFQAQKPPWSSPAKTTSSPYPNATCDLYALLTNLGSLNVASICFIVQDSCRSARAVAGRCRPTCPFVLSNSRIVESKLPTNNESFGDVGDATTLVTGAEYTIENFDRQSSGSRIPLVCTYLL